MHVIEKNCRPLDPAMGSQKEISNWSMANIEEYFRFGVRNRCLYECVLNINAILCEMLNGY